MERNYAMPSIKNLIPAPPGISEPIDRVYVDLSNKVKHIQLKKEDVKGVSWTFPHNGDGKERLAYQVLNHDTKKIAEIPHEKMACIYWNADQALTEYWINKPPLRKTTLSRIRQHLTATNDLESQPNKAMVFRLGGQEMKAIDLLVARKATHLWTAGMRYGEANGRWAEWAMDNMK
ncbi:hypothetical protein QFC24_002432 [Naganishia onofrii]|uniref:Uncharacterized protein n=1 Tax=Naganishia onofrii TaxID=1851511 RepID=A0ACC2XQ26_9TREE|nr:hypothetical protein QFC24_002432 [Naganishia onofrii]